MVIYDCSMLRWLLPCGWNLIDYSDVWIVLVGFAVLYQDNVDDWSKDSACTALVVLWDLSWKFVVNKNVLMLRCRIDSLDVVAWLRYLIWW